MTEPTKKQEALIKTMVDEGENLTDAINVVCPNLPVPESKKLYNRVYRSFRRKQDKESGISKEGKHNVHDHLILAEIERVIDNTDATTFDEVSRAISYRTKDVLRVWKTREAMLDSDDFESFAGDHYTEDLCSRDQARAVWCAMYPEDEKNKSIKCFVSGMAHFGALPELDDDERELCRLNALHSSTLRTVDDCFNRRTKAREATV